jgi:monoterpene epsilon-lactone hydrolase
MKTPLPKGIICFSPWTDLLLKNASHQTNKKRDVCLVMPNEFILFQNINLSHPYLSPIYANFKDIPDIFIQVSDAEILLDDSILLAEKAKLQGVKITLEIWKDLPHCFQLFAQYIPEGKQAFSHIIEFIDSH